MTILLPHLRSCTGTARRRFAEGRLRPGDVMAAGPVAPISRASGSAVLVVFMMLAVIGVLIICNSRTLYILKQELRLVEEKQLRKFAPLAAVRTNTPGAAAIVPRSSAR